MEGRRGRGAEGRHSRPNKAIGCHDRNTHRLVDSLKVEQAATAMTGTRGATITTALVPMTGQTTGQTVQTIRTGTADDRQLLGRFTAHRASFFKYCLYVYTYVIHRLFIIQPNILFL